MYVAPGYGRSYAAGYSSSGSAAGYVYAAVIALFSLIFMIGQFTFKMVKVEWTSRHSTKYSFGKLAFDESGITEDGITLFVSLLSFLCIMTAIAFLIVAFILTKKRPSTGVKFAAASMIPIIVGRLGLILEVIHLKDGSDSIHICGSVIFSLLFCTLLCIAAFILSSTVSNR